jgi:membrane protease subunit (stomatin/prohibitin family)
VPKALDDAFRRSYARLDKRFASADQFTAALGSIPAPAAKVARVQSQARVVRAPVSTISCPRCHQPVDQLDQFCMHCGVQMVTTVRRCPKCGAYPDGTDRYCIFCGENVSPELTMV